MNKFHDVYYIVHRTHVLHDVPISLCLWFLQPNIYMTTPNRLYMRIYRPLPLGTRTWHSSMRRVQKAAQELSN